MVRGADKLLTSLWFLKHRKSPRTHDCESRELFRIPIIGTPDRRLERFDFKTQTPALLCNRIAI
jgi:hypothetical protein